jgi:hypothetical protein
MLALFRQQAPGEVQQMMQLFNLLPASDKMELLLHMHISGASNLAQLHNMLQALANHVTTGGQDA